MKKLLKNVLFVGAIGSVGILASCGGDDEVVPPAQPSIEVAVSGLEDTTEPYEAAPGETVTFTVTMDVPGMFNVLTVTTSVDGTAATPEDYPRGNAAITANAENTQASTTLNYEFDAEDVGSEYEFEFVVVDDSNQKATSTVTVTVVSPAARSYTAVLLAAPLGTTTAEKTSETFFSTNTGETYSMAEVIASIDPLSADIDFGYFYGSGTASTGATLASPAAYPFAYGQADWGTRNATNFRRTALDEAAFLEVTTWAAIDAAVEEADAADDDPGIESGLVEGEVLAFTTASTKEGGSKSGLILVKSITPGDGVTGQIELEILVQEEAGE